MSIDTSGQVSIRGEGSATTTNLQQGLCKAWATFNATGTAATRDTFNVSGLTDNGTGDFSFAFSSNFETANAYVAGGLVAHSSQSTATYTLRAYSSSTLTTSSARMSMVYNTDSAQGVSDYAYGSTLMHGDLA
tara:strand:+ start:56 stop:454 length:399 start_codon:yes stop_codon:yes gene_type:complete